MFVQLTVAGIIAMLALSSIFVPEEVWQQRAEEWVFDDSDESGDGSEDLPYWRKALASIQMSVAVSAGLGTLFTALLSYRLGQGRLAQFRRRLQEWIRREECPVDVILQPSAVNFQQESKETIGEQFHEAIEDTLYTFSQPPGLITRRIVGNFESTYNTDESNEVPFETRFNKDKSHEMQTKAFDEDELDLQNADNLDTGESKFKTVEARVLAADDPVVYDDISTRMRTFEKQLDDFKNIRQPDGYSSDISTAIASAIPSEISYSLGGDSCGEGQFEGALPGGINCDILANLTAGLNDGIFNEYNNQFNIFSNLIFLPEANRQQPDRSFFANPELEEGLKRLGLTEEDGLDSDLIARAYRRFQGLEDGDQNPNPADAKPKEAEAGDGQAEEEDKPMTFVGSEPLQVKREPPGGDRIFFSKSAEHIPEQVPEAEPTQRGKPPPKPRYNLRYQRPPPPVTRKDSKTGFPTTLSDGLGKRDTQATKVPNVDSVTKTPNIPTPPSSRKTPTRTKQQMKEILQSTGVKLSQRQKKNNRN